MWESSNIRVHLTGKVVVTMGTQSHGQGHETTYAQIISHELGVPMEDIVVQHSDTQGTPFGYGSYGSRTSNVGTGAALKAAGKIKEKARKFAAHLLEASPEDIEIDGPNYRVKGSPDKVKTIQEIAFALDLAFDPPEGMEPYLDESATVRVNPTGGVSVFTGSHSHGQGHETSFAQVVSDLLGIDAAQVDIVHGDTARVPFGMGTYGSRSLAVGGSAIVRSVEKIVAKAKKIAAHLMEASDQDVVFENGRFTVAGTDKSVAWTDVTLAAYVPHKYPIEELEPGLEETSFYDPANFTYPAGAYACEVEIDPETGVVEIIAFSAADDFGNIVNPMIVEGQVHGGIAQGIGQAMLEAAAYDEAGQLRSGSLMDYAMPRADDLPNFAVDHSCVTPCTHNPLGVKGCGEAGAIGSPPALVNAVLDALNAGGFRVAHIDMPLTPARVWAAMAAAE
jgi:CO/xanthine dehydrogenase Mo-binding subunit